MIRTTDPQIRPQCKNAFLDSKPGHISRKEQGIALFAYMLVGFLGAVFLVGISDSIDTRILLLFPLNIAFGLVFWWRNLRKTMPLTIYCHSCGYAMSAQK